MFTDFSADYQPIDNVSPYPPGTQMHVISLSSHTRPTGRPRVSDHLLGKVHFDEITAGQGENANLRRARGPIQVDWFVYTIEEGEGPRLDSAIGV